MSSSSGESRLPESGAPAPADESADRLKFIFADPQGKRWPRTRGWLLLFGLVALFGAVQFIRVLLIPSPLHVPLEVRQMKQELKALAQKEAAARPPEVNLWQQYADKHPKKVGEFRRRVLPATEDHRPVRLGFYSGWDINSFGELAQHGTDLTHVCSEWMSLDDGKGAIAEEQDQRVVDYCAANGLKLLLTLDNLQEDRWEPEKVENLASGPAENREALIRNILAVLDRTQATGLALNWQEVDTARRDDLTALVLQIAKALHAHNKELWFCVSMGHETVAAFDLDKIAEETDRFIGFFHDENSEKDGEGPIASRAWVEGWMNTMADYGDASQWVASLGSYGYDWTAGAKEATTIPFTDVMGRAAHAGVTDIKVDAPDFSPHFSYISDDRTHAIWFLDAVTFYNQAQYAQDKGFGGIGLNRLGTEDPAVWSAWRLADASTPPTPAQLGPLGELKAEESLCHVGEGEFLEVDAEFSDGARDVTVGADGMMTCRYITCPRYLTVLHRGGAVSDRIALTFDDGPDPTFTPQILDILKRFKMKACFFLLGVNAERYPDLVRRIIAEGHEIGNHTFFHPNLALASQRETELELNATQRLIESITGRSTLYFRPPYQADSRPHDLAEIKALQRAQDLGYVTVGQEIDPRDYEKPGADVIVQRVKEQRHAGSIMLMHDAGGDRTQTVAALPRVLRYLQERGDKVISLSEMLGVSKEEMMPRVSSQGEEPVLEMVNRVGFNTVHLIQGLMWAFMILASGLVALRMLIIVGLALYHKKLEHAQEAALKVAIANATPIPTPAVSIVVAAYNEGKVIEAGLRSLLETDYAGTVEIIVVDDGSKDDTAEVVRRVAQTESRVRLFVQANAGKAAALRHGLTEAQHDLYIFVDADTHFQRDTIRHLVAPFADERVGAVSGQAKVGNRRTLITRFQSLEYVCGFNLDRRAYDVINGVTVVPGAIGAFRRSALEEAGGFSTDTLAEDTDLTLMLHRRDWRIAYAPEALAWTEAPETFATLAKQRFRWAFGTMQCLWKHRDMVFNPRYRWLGLFTLPSLWFFQIVLVAFTPIIDLLLVGSLISGPNPLLYLYFCLFLLTDWVLAAAACWIEGEPMARSLYIVPMRLCYRPLLSWVVWRSIRSAFRGLAVGWGKLERTANVVAKPVANVVPINEAPISSRPGQSGPGLAAVEDASATGKDLK